MALSSFLPSTDPTTSLPLSHHHHKTNTTTKTKKKKNNNKKKKSLPPSSPPPPKPSSSWEHFKNLLSCKNTSPGPSSHVHDPSSAKTKYACRLSSTCGSSICAIRDVVHGNTRVIHRPDSDPSSSSDSGSHNDSTPLSSAAAAPSRSLRPTAAAAAPRSGGRQLMKLSGCYECHAVDAQSASRRYPRPRTLNPCTECGEVFTKPESLELHQAIRHAVYELGPDDSGRHIVEIIFKSSWTFQRHMDSPLGPTTAGGRVNIGRILKIHNTQRTIARFEDYRDSVKSNSLRGPHHRSAADGNELLRFHSTSIACSLGSDGSTSLCLRHIASSPTASNPCSVCTIIRYGFARAHQGPIRTTASSGRAHECSSGNNSCPGGMWRAMLVCRVIAGRVRRKGVDADWEEVPGLYDSVTGPGDKNLEELFVANPRAILPCFVVIYRALA